MIRIRPWTEEEKIHTMKTTEFVVSFVLVCIFVYILWSLSCRGPMEDDEDLDDYAEEGFDNPNGPATGQANAAAAPPSLDLQEAINLSDINVTPKQREEWQAHVQQSQQIQTVNERFEAAERRTEEYKLKPGVYTNQRRRQLIENLVRRPSCGKRRRGWRTEFSDIMRGDVIPKNVNQDGFGMMRIGRKDPRVDLHPGALGPLSGRSGAWVSEENIPGNMFDDAEAVITE